MVKPVLVSQSPSMSQLRLPWVQCAQSPKGMIRPVRLLADHSRGPRWGIRTGILSSLSLRPLVRTPLVSLFILPLWHLSVRASMMIILEKTCLLLFLGLCGIRRFSRVGKPEKAC